MEQIEYVSNEIDSRKEIFEGQKNCSKKAYKDLIISFNSFGNKIFEFDHKGVSFQYLSNKLQVSKSTVSELIKYGEQNGFFICHKNKEVVYKGEKNENINLFIETNKHLYSFGFLYSNKHNMVIWNKPNKYSNIYNYTCVNNDINTTQNNCINNNDEYNNGLIPYNYTNDHNACLEHYNVVSTAYHTYKPTL
ncbi:MAG: hypothetical protein ACI35S_06730 [Anaeroplasma sp.]